MKMNGTVLELAGLCPDWLSLVEHSNYVRKTDQWLHHDVVGKSVTLVSNVLPMLS